MPGSTPQRARTSAGIFSGSVSLPRLAPLPWVPILTRPRFASITAYAPKMPPVARSSAEFWDTSRYRRGPSAPSSGGSSRPARSAAEVIVASRSSSPRNVPSASRTCLSSRSASTAASSARVRCTAASTLTSSSLTARTPARSSRPSRGTRLPRSTRTSAGKACRARSSTATAICRTAERLAPAYGTCRPSRQPGSPVARRAAADCSWSAARTRWARSASPLTRWALSAPASPAALTRWARACQPRNPTHPARLNTSEPTTSEPSSARRRRTRRRRCGRRCEVPRSVTPTPLPEPGRSHHCSNT